MMLDAVKVEELLNSFGEVTSRLLLDEYQKHLAEIDLTLLQAQVLRVLRRDGMLPTGQLTTELRMSAPGVTGLTDRLVRKELIKRCAAEGDRRTVMLMLTAKGKRLVDQFRKRRSHVFLGAMNELSEADQSLVFLALEKIVGALEKQEFATATKQQ